MCIFAQPVPSVSNTRIFVGSTGNRQVTCYAMSAELRGRGNAMILPVPGGDIRLIDMSAVPDFFDDLDSHWRQVSRGMRDLSFSAPTKSVLPIHNVGSYSVSIAPAVEDIDRADPTVFGLSADTRQTLERNYSDPRYSFVIAVLKKSGDFHPLAYSHNLAPEGLFIPTRHEGHDAVWDHSLYLVGHHQSPVKTSRWLSEVRGRSNTYRVRGAPEEVNAALDTMSRLGATRMRVTGRQPNTDLWMSP